MLGTQLTDPSMCLEVGQGPGKTFCVSLLSELPFIRALLRDKGWYRIAVTGPTNKSVTGHS